MQNVTEKERELLDRARQACDNAYAPYTKKTTGAAVLTRDGRIFTGCKVELVSFAGSICAEQSAISAAVAAGARDLEAIAIYPAVYPCGVCRQALLEFNSKFSVLIETDKSVRRLALADLLPYSFGPEQLTT